MFRHWMIAAVTLATIAGGATAGASQRTGGPATTLRVDTMTDPIGLSIPADTTAEIWVPQHAVYHVGPGTYQFNFVAQPLWPLKLHVSRTG